MTLAVAALFADGPTRIDNVYNWRVKETERMVAIVTECRKLGAEVCQPQPFMCIASRPQLKYEPRQAMTPAAGMYAHAAKCRAFSLARYGLLNSSVRL